MHFRELEGHSGCRIILAEDNGRVFVRKVSRSTGYNARLEAQARKQSAFRSEYLSAPAVYSAGFTSEGLYYFDMEYISGITLAEYMKTIQACSIRSIVRALMLSMNTGTAETSGDPQQVFSRKIRSLEEELAGSGSPAVSEAFAVLSGHKWNKFTPGFCHGDLTLENIIVKDGRLYLIDFLDSFYDCWIMDAATLLQDVYAMWSYRRQVQDINTVIHLMIFRDIMTDIIAETAGDDVVVEVYYALLLKLLRIYPYTDDKPTLDFLDAKTATVTGMIARTHEDADNSLCRR
ncbi:MAG: phosphotransferase [Synergistaceae bacterium]|nr:phosphotransferase [Synergistaceae bacterium]